MEKRGTHGPVEGGRRELLLGRAVLIDVSPLAELRVR